MKWIKENNVFVYTCILNITAGLIYYFVPGSTDKINNNLINKSGKYSVVLTGFIGQIIHQFLVLRKLESFSQMGIPKELMATGFLVTCLGYFVIAICFAMWVKGKYEHDKKVLWAGFFLAGIIASFLYFASKIYLRNFQLSFIPFLSFWLRGKLFLALFIGNEFILKDFLFWSTLLERNFQLESYVPFLPFRLRGYLFLALFIGNE